MDHVCEKNADADAEADADADAEARERLDRSRGIAAVCDLVIRSDPHSLCLALCRKASVGAGGNDGKGKREIHVRGVEEQFWSEPCDLSLHPIQPLFSLHGAAHANGSFLQRRAELELNGCAANRWLLQLSCLSFQCSLHHEQTYGERHGCLLEFLSNTELYTGRV